MTVNDFLSVFPAASEARHDTSVLSTANVSPDRGLQLIVMLPRTLSPCLSMPSSLNVAVPSTMSVADTGNVTMAPSVVATLLDIDGGTVRAGGVVSCTVTGKLPLALLPELSLASQLTVVVPNSNVSPDRGLQLIVMLPRT